MSHINKAESLCLMSELTRGQYTHIAGVHGGLKARGIDVGEKLGRIPGKADSSGTIHFISVVRNK